jgi:lysophospholipase L1-like esterase
VKSATIFTHCFSSLSTGDWRLATDINSMQKTLRIVALGDSTTAGTPGWKSPVEAPPAGAGDETSQFAYWLSKAHPEWEVLNRGVNGERSDQIRARFERDVLEAAPAIVIVIAGVNDVYQGRPAAHVIEQLRWMFDRAKQARIRVVAGSVIPYNTATGVQNAVMREINTRIRQHAESDPNVEFVDTRAAAAAADDPDRLFDSPDELHPSPSGYRRMADAIRVVVERIAARE